VDLLTIVLACSLHFDDELVLALVRKVSNDNPLLVGDLVTLTTHDSLSTVADAQAAVEDILKHGGRPAVGLLGVPITWAARYGRQPKDLFDSCVNVAVGTAALSEYAALCLPRPAKAAKKRARPPASPRALAAQRTCILRHLGDDLGASGYVDAVLSEIAARRTTPRASDLDPPAAMSSIDAQGEDDAHAPASSPIAVTPAPISPPSSRSASPSNRPIHSPPVPTAPSLHAPPAVTRSRR
jgi:hypothetical protein